MKGEEIYKSIEKGFIALSVLFVMFLMTSIFTLGLWVILFTSFSVGGRIFLGGLALTSYLSLLWGAFLLPYWKAFSEYLKSEEKNKK